MAKSGAPTPDEYIAQLEPDRAREIAHVRDLINSVLPNGYVERMAFGMISWQVPLEVSGPTYNRQPLLYAGLAAQKNHNALHLMCAYASKQRSERLKKAFADAGKKLDMGKSCIRFKKADDLAADAIIAEISSVTPRQFVDITEAARKGQASSSS